MGLPVEVNNLMMGSLGGYNINRSLRFRSSASAYLNRTAGTPTNANIWTWSGWVKRGTLSTRNTIMCGGSTNVNYICFNDSGTTDYFGLTYSNSPSQLVNVMTTQVFRDPSAWYHLMVVYDSTSATSTITGSATDRVRLYVNGSQVTAFSATSGPAQNTSVNINAASSVLNIGRRNVASPDSYLDGYLAEVNFIDGQALTPSSFGAYDTNGVWQPKKYTGTYGTNGFYLPFSNTTSTTTLVQDSSGNGNNWTPNNISLTAGTTYDSMIDSPTVSASASNYCVGNPLNPDGSTWSSGNLNFSLPNGTGNAQATFAVTTGKWYWEVVYTAQPNYTGVQQAGLTTRFTNGVLYGAAGDKNVNGTTSAYGATYTNGDVIGVALDMTGGTVTFYKNNTSQGSISLSGAGITNATFTLSAGGGSTSTGSVNFGQRPFSYTPPTGFNALNTYNLPAATITNGAQYMAATTYTGDATSPRTVTNGGNNTLGITFQPDLVWQKQRSGVFNNILVDSVRGGSPGLAVLQSNLTDAEYTSLGVNGGISSITSSGFVITAGSSANTNLNANGSTYVAWQWKAGGTGVTNNSGTITSTVSANPTAGFSVVTYTGTGANATVGHGLGVAPSMIIIKNRTLGTENWAVYHTSTGAGNWLLLSGTNAAIANTTIWQNTSPTSSVFSLGPISNTNVSGSNFVAYCFAAVSGYSAFGSYTGNGSTDGPFVYLGFRPRWIMIKSTGVESWSVVDTSRSPYNQEDASLFPNLSNAEGTGNTVSDILSNGFKLRNTWAGSNASGQTYVWAAFCENPFKYSRGR